MRKLSSSCVSKLYGLLKKQQNLIKIGDFTLSSGKKTKFYVDLKTILLSNWSVLCSVRESYIRFFEDTCDTCDRIVGMELGSVPIMSVISYSYYVPFNIIRRRKKEYGSQNRIEGLYNTGDNALVVDDITTTGKSILEVVEVCREAGMVVNKAFSIIDREEGAKELLEKHGVKLSPTFSIFDFKTKEELGIVD